MPVSETIGVDALLDMKGADKSAKAYAFLYAAFRKTEVSRNPVRDALDCITPFIAPYLNRTAGKQVDLSAVQNFLKTTIGFDIPLYALEQVMPSIEKAGFAEYNKVTRIYTAKRADTSFDIAKVEIETDFDLVEEQLSRHARVLGVERPPSSAPTWGDALISFLKARSEASAGQVLKMRGTLLDPSRVEDAIIGSFIRNLYDAGSTTFEKLLRVFMGVLIEDFISSVAEIGSFKSGEPVNIFYDTAVLLRLLGCSGKLLRSATEELTSYLQDLGCRIYYLSGNEAEVGNILQTIIFVKDSGRELEGETAEAVSSGEVTITDLRLLQNTFAEKLAQLNIFPADTLEGNTQALTQFQIDEKAFSEHLYQQALKAKKPYSLQNRSNDASYLGTVMRLRRNVKTRDFAECRYIFITTNRFLASTARRFLLQNRVLQPQHCPPMLSVQQVATIAWLMKDQVLVPEKAGRELLSHCFAAVRPDGEWFRYFREGMERVVGPLDSFAAESTSSITLQAARRIAQDESLGNSALVRELNMAEILQRARDQAEAEKARSERAAAEAQKALETAAENKLASERLQAQELLQAAELEKSVAVERAAANARAELYQQMREDTRRKAQRWAQRIIWVLRILLLAMFAASAVYELIYREAGPVAVIAAITLIVAILSFGDMIGLPWPKQWLESLQLFVANRLTGLLQHSASEDTSRSDRLD
jgi:hypothetical protein